MEFGMFHEFQRRVGQSEAEAFTESFELVDAAETAGLDVMWLADWPHSSRLCSRRWPNTAVQWVRAAPAAPVTRCGRGGCTESQGEECMQLGMIGLGRMGGNMTERCMRAGHEMVVYDRNPETVAGYVAKGAAGAASVVDLVGKLRAPKAIWLMLPAGAATEAEVTELGEMLQRGDIIIDGGNSMFKDDVRRAKTLQAKGIHYVDVGTSGGVWGLERGYCMMIGGAKEAVDHLDPIFATLAPGRGNIDRTPGREKMSGTSEDGYIHCGPAGSGHFVKMVHNGIEYGLMQAYAEGFDIFRNANSLELPEEHRFDLNLADIAEVWRRGSVVSSWLLDLSAMALIENPDLSDYTGFVQDSGEGRCTIMAAVEEAVPADVLSASLYTRFRSRQEHTFAEKILSAMRHKFGGHIERPAGG